MAEIGAASKYSRHYNIHKMVFSCPVHPGGLAGTLFTQSKTLTLSVGSITYPLVSLLFTDASKVMLLPLAQGQNQAPQSIFPQKTIIPPHEIYEFADDPNNP